MSLRAADFTTVVKLVERLSDANGLNARYEDVMDAVVAAVAAADDDGVNSKLVAPEDVI